jgi:hypothetical protein
MTPGCNSRGRGAVPIFAAALSLAALPGCDRIRHETLISPDVRLVRTDIAALRDAARDPNSVTVSEVKYWRSPVSGSHFTCGNFNGTNGYGGYVGKTPFLVIRSGSSSDPAIWNDSMFDADAPYLDRDMKKLWDSCQADGAAVDNSALSEKGAA